MSGLSILDVFTEDLLVRVRGEIGDELDAKTWRLVCKEFLRVDSLTRSTLRVNRIEFLFQLLEKYPNVRTLDLSLCPRVNDGIISSLLSRTRNSLSWTRSLKSLNLRRATGLRYKGLNLELCSLETLFVTSLVKVLIFYIFFLTGLEMLAIACVCLESVDVSYCCGFGDREAAALSHAGGLSELKMDKCLNVTDVGLAKIAIGCLNLERLSLKWCLEISDLGIDLLCKKCQNLKSLDLSYLKVSLCFIDKVMFGWW